MTGRWAAISTVAKRELAAYFESPVAYVFLVLVPAAGMRLWSEERRLGTIELLLTMPVATWQAILGKFLASWLFLVIAVVLSLLLILVGFSPLTDLLARWASPWLVEAVTKFSVLTHYDGFQKGVLESRDLLYFLSVMAFTLFATGVVIRSHRAG